MSHLRVSFSAFDPPAAQVTGRMSLDSQSFAAAGRPALSTWRHPTAPVYISVAEPPRRITMVVLASASVLMLAAAGAVWAL